MTAATERAAERAAYRLASYPPRLAASAAAGERLSCAYDWFRAASPTARVMDAAARELARLAERADRRTAADVAVPDSAPPKLPPYARSRARARGAA